MVARSILALRLRHHLISPTLVRTLSTVPKPQSPPALTIAQQKPAQPQKSWLTRKLQENPAAMRAFLNLATLLGYGSKKQLSGRRAYGMYHRICVPKPDEDKSFWQNECHLPPTFQSWFSVTNLHVWLLTVRLRALPEPYGKYHIQGLVDHFFLDVEDRVRAILQPKTLKTSPSSPPTLTPSESSPSSSPSSPTSAPTQEPPTLSSFYTIANGTGRDKRPKGSAPESLVTRQMKIFKEQWAGLGVSMDVALVKGDAEMAGAVWRNFLGARGARGIVYPSLSPSSSSLVSAEEGSDAGEGSEGGKLEEEQAGKQTKYFRRSINLVGGSVESVKKIDKLGLEAEEARDDGSGVHDYAPEEADKYVKYPELMLQVTEYVRRELKRLEGLSDEDVLGPMRIGKELVGLEKLRFGRIRAP